MTWYEIYDDCYINTDNIIKLEAKKHPNQKYDCGIWADYVDHNGEWVIYGRTEDAVKRIVKEMISQVEKGI